MEQTPNNFFPKKRENKIKGNAPRLRVRESCKGAKVRKQMAKRKNPEVEKQYTY